ncbi:unnamed protein product [Medioppia subpectinata]|uniref:Major facilitator superfamily (MFS) profile domain-containing protein n=1 Tax=Medioppia subpectinata TaxID=1979941 RepID=A0A7R9Q887_9ACAR|nr:unnamed protein product [Medioppia subpectinata]CAG2116434.1 unnamed protein product [Medioppia subpectinata]
MHKQLNKKHDHPLRPWFILGYLMNVKMDCEEVIEKVGSFGLYQKILGLFLCLLIAPFFAFNDITQFLLFVEPNHSCTHPTEQVYVYNDIVWFDASDKKIVKQCEIIDTLGNKTNCIYGHQYNYSHIYPTIVSENNWVCEQNWKVYFAYKIYWTGSLVGVYVIGAIADRYGKVPAIGVCHLIGAIAGTTTVFFAHNFVILLISRALMGFVVLSQGMFAVVLVMEFVGIDGRMIISTLFLFSYSITAAILPWIAYYIHNWRILSVITSAPLFIVPLYSGIDSLVDIERKARKGSKDTQKNCDHKQKKHF